MAGANVSGNRGLNFTAHLRIDEAKRNAEDLKKTYKELATLAANSGAAGGSTPNSGLNIAPLSAYRQAQLQMQQALTDSRLEIKRLKAEQEQLRVQTEQLRVTQQAAKTQTEQLRIAEQNLRTQFQQGRLTQQQYTTALTQSRAQQAALNATLVQSRIDTQNLRTQTAALNLQQRQQAAAAKAARQAQVAANGSYQQATERLKQLGQQIRSVEGGFASTSRLQQARIREYQQLNRQLQDFDTQMGNNQRRVGAYRQSMGALSSNIQGLIGNYLSFYAVISTGARALRVNSEISDSLADVSRTAGLTTESANALIESLKQIDTRTSLKGLVDIAIIGGQLGIAEKDLTGFTRAIDQLAITLSGEIPGGAEAVASALGKINGVFKVLDKEGTTVEQSFNKTGSAILKLGQVGLATGEFLQDFGLRVAGAANAANIALPTILAYGAVLEEAGSSAEVSGTALNRLIGSLAGKREQFFAIAKIADSTLTLKEFTRVINTDANAALQMFFAGLNKGGVNLTSFNDLLDQIGLRAGPSKNAIVALAQNQEILTERISQGTEAYNDGTLSAEQFAIKNDTLAGALEKVSKAFDQILQGDGIGRVFKEIANGLAGTLTYFDKLIGSNSWKEFFFRLDPKTSNTAKFAGLADQADAIRAENDPKLWVQRESKKYQALDAEMQKRALETQRFRTNNAKVEAQEAIRAYKEQVDKINKMNKKLGADDQKDPMDYGFVQKAKEAKDRLRDEALKQDALLKTMLTKTVVRGKVAKVDPDGGVTLPDGKSSDAEAKKAQTALNAQRSLQAKIDELTKKGVDKQLSADEQELESVREKYRKLREEAIKFNNDPANKKRGLRVDSGSLTQAQDTEITAIKAKQAVTDLKGQLEEEKRLYEEYEFYKDKLGKEKADARFADRLKGEESYLEKLLRMEEEILSPQQSKGADSGNSIGVIDQAKLKEIQSRIAVEKDLEDRKNAEIYRDAYQAAMTYTQRRVQIEQEYNAMVKALGSEATAEQIANLKIKRDAMINSANEENAYAKSGYEQLMQNYDAMTRQQILKRLEVIKAGYRAEYAAGRLTAEQMAALISAIDGQIEGLNGSNVFNKITASIKKYKDALATLPKDSIAVKNAQREMYGTIAEGAQAAGEISAGLQGIFADLGIGGEKLQVVLGQVGGIMEGVGGIANGIKDQDPVAIVVGSIKLLASAIDMFNSKDRKLERKIKAYQEQLSSLGRSFAKLERDVNNSVGDSFYADSAKQIENLREQQDLLAKARQAEIDKKKTDQGKVSEYEDQMIAIDNQIADINKSISEMLIQTSFKDLASSLANAFDEAFQAGEDAVGRFDDAFDAMIVNAVKNSLKLKLLEPIIAEFTDELTEYAQNNANSVVGFDFEKWRKAIYAKGEVYTEGLKAIEEYFPDADSGSANDNSLQGAYSTASQESITLLAGQTSGMRIAQLQTNTILTGIGKTIGDFFNMAKDNFNTMLKIEANTARTANNTDKLESIDASLVALNRKIDNNANAAKAAGF